MLFWFRDLISSMMTFLLCIAGLAILIDPDAALIKFQLLAEDLFSYLLSELSDLPSLIESLLRQLKR